MKPAGGLVAEHVPTPSSVEQDLAEKRDQRLVEALRITQVVSRMIGKELPIVSVGEEAEISGEPGIYILDSDGTERATVSSVSFTLQPEFLSGKADSAHAVLGGVWHMEREEGQDSVQLPIVAKCFQKRDEEDRKTRALREITIMQEMKRRGLLGIRPLALIIAPNDDIVPGHQGEAVIISARDEGLLSMDNTPWGRGPTPANMEAAVAAVTALSSFNKMGFWHLDAKIKNFARRVVGAETNAIDFETTLSFDVSDPGALAQVVFEDFGKLLDSLKDKRFLRPNESYSVNDILTYLADAYFEQWTSASTDCQSAVCNGVMSVLENFTAPEIAA